MHIEDIKKLVVHGESDSLEFKTSLTQLKPTLKTVCAFLNTKGGTVVIGVNDKGQFIGQTINDKTQQEIAKELSKIEPNPQVDIHYISISNNKTIIVFEVTNVDHAPYIYDGRAYYRNQTTTLRMSQHHYEQLLVKRGHLNYSWEEGITTEHTIEDLDKEEIYKMLSEGVNEGRIPASAQ